MRHLNSVFVVKEKIGDLESIVDELRSKTRWIRDELHPRVSRGGPKALDADSLHELKIFLRWLSKTSLPREAIRQSRVHKALGLIMDRQMHWPNDMASMCDPICEEWTNRYGNLQNIRVDLYEPGGRLYGIAEPWEISRRELVRRWSTDMHSVVSPLRAFEYGGMDFGPGHWWIHPIFAYHDGIISSPDPKGGITADSEGAYAITLTHIDNIDDKQSEFKYKIRNDDPGRFRLINNFLPVKAPIRVLRSHTLRSTYAPVAGIRYDGLYKVTDWRARSVNGEWAFDVKLSQDLDQTTLSRVIRHPVAEEVDDYLEYRQVRAEQEEISAKQQDWMPSKQLPRSSANSSEQRSPTAILSESGSQQQSRQLTPERRSSNHEDFPLRERGSGLRHVAIDEADREELRELKSFAFPTTKSNRLLRSRPLTGFWVAESSE